MAATQLLQHPIGTRVVQRSVLETVRDVNLWFDPGLAKLERYFQKDDTAGRNPLVRGGEYEGYFECGNFPAGTSFSSHQFTNLERVKAPPHPFLTASPAKCFSGASSPVAPSVRE
jgi:hypothetical protein